MVIVDNTLAPSVFRNAVNDLAESEVGKIKIEPATTGSWTQAMRHDPFENRHGQGQKVETLLPFYDRPLAISDLLAPKANIAALMMTGGVTAVLDCVKTLPPETQGTLLLKAYSEILVVSNTAQQARSMGVDVAHSTLKRADDIASQVLDEVRRISSELGWEQAAQPVVARYKRIATTRVSGTTMEALAGVVSTALDGIAEGLTPSLLRPLRVRAPISARDYTEGVG